MEDLQNRLNKIENDMIQFKNNQPFSSDDYSLYLSEVTLPEQKKLDVIEYSVIEFIPMDSGVEYLAVMDKLPRGVPTYGAPNRWRRQNFVSSERKFYVISTTPGILKIVRTEEQKWNNYNGNIRIK